MPGGSSNAMSNQSTFVQTVDSFYNGVVGTFFFSILLLCVLIKYRDPLTPDFLHFTTCMVEEEAHFIWVMFLWLSYKCFLDVD